MESHPVKRAFLSIGVSPNDLERAARLEPSVLAVDKLDRLHGMIDLLLGASLSPSDIGQVLLAYPQVRESVVSTRATVPLLWAF